MNIDIIRRILLGLGAVIGFGLLIWAGYEFVFKGTLLIEGGDASLNVIVTANDGSVVAHGSSNQYRLTPGDYLVSVTTSTSGTSKLVSIGVLSTTTLKTGEVKTMNASLAIQAPLYGAIPANQWFIGLDPTTERITRFDNQGNGTNKLGSQSPIGQEDEWEPEIPERVTSFAPYAGPGALVASSTKLFSIKGQGINEVSLEGVNLGSSLFPDITIGSNQQQESFVAGINATLYSYQNSLAKAQKIYSGKKQFDQIAYGGDYAIAYSTILPVTDQDIRSFYDGYQIDALVINVKNQQIFTLPGPLTSATVSPDGKYATIQPRGAQPYLYDIAAKRRVVTLDQPDAAMQYWNGNQSFIYEKDKHVWQYNIERQASDLIAIVNKHITSFTSDGKGGYLASYYNGLADNGVININAAAPPATVATPDLAGAFPYSGDGFSITYSNAGTPTITITTNAILNRADQLPQYRAETQAMRQRALDYLKAQKIDLTGVTIVYDPADPL